MGEHLRVCPVCRGKLERMRAGNHFLAEMCSALAADRTAFPEEIDRAVLSHVSASLTSLSSPVPLPANRHTPHPEAPSIPDYVLLDRIGAGSFGNVWRAEDVFCHQVAVKVVEIREDRRTCEYELNGIRQGMTLRHPNISEIRHVGHVGKYWYYVMELVCDTLEARLQRDMILGAEESLGIIRQLLAAIEACHKHQLAHRDIKPANIGFDSGGRLKLLDLGLVTDSGRSNRSVIGTPDYMPFKPADTPDLDDIYAAGIILYRMLTGLPPRRFPELPPQFQRQPLAASLVELAIRAADPLPQKRFVNVGAFMNALHASERSVRGARIPSSQRRSYQTTNNLMLNDAIQKIQKTINFLDANKLPVSVRTRQMLSGMENPVYRVAFVGQFQVGKSTLINRAFLKEEFLLKEGTGICTTAVATEIAFGETKRLQVFPWLKRTEKLTCGDKSTECEVNAGIGQPVTVDNPTQEQVSQATTAETEPERLVLAQKTANVRLEWPADSLTKYVIYDTPGIDDPNQRLLDETTYRVIPSVDAAVLVVRPTMLDQIDKSFLMSRVFDAGLSRIMVLISFNAETQRMSTAARRELMETIRSQLRSIGRDHVPVRMFCYSTDVDGEILNTPDAIEAEVVDFIDKNAASGRIEKAGYIVQQDVKNALVTIATKLATADKSAAELNELKDKLQKMEDELADKYQGIKNRLDLDIQALQRDADAGFAVGCDKAAKLYLDGFDDCTGLAAVRKHLDKAHTILKPQLEELVATLAKSTADRFTAIVARYNEELARLAESLRGAMPIDLQINAGWFGRLNPTLVLVGDYALSVFLTPFAWPIDIALRFFAEKIPFIKNILPSSLAGKLAVRTIKESVLKNMNDLKANMAARLQEAFASVSERVKDEFSKTYMQQIAPINNAVEEALKNPTNLTSEERKHLVSLKLQLEQIDLTSAQKS